jgi:hypothetical protein
VGEVKNFDKDLVEEIRNCDTSSNLFFLIRMNTESHFKEFGVGGLPYVKYTKLKLPIFFIPFI